MVDRVDGMKTVSSDPDFVIVIFLPIILFRFAGQRIGWTEDIRQRRAFQLHAVPQELDWPTLHGLVAGLVYGPWSVRRKSSHRPLPPPFVYRLYVYVCVCVFSLRNPEPSYWPTATFMTTNPGVSDYVWSVPFWTVSGARKRKKIKHAFIVPVYATRRFFFHCHSSDYGRGGCLKMVVLVVVVVVVVPVHKFLPWPPLPPCAQKSSRGFTHRGHDNNDWWRYEKVDTIIM